MKTKTVVQKAIESELEELNDRQLVFIIRALIASGHVSEGLVRDTLKLVGWVRPS